ncbi:unnamed protein product [Caenorhabditis angaria]|uniref:Ubiquitin-conjugating enzyme E2 J2 n=1 Tax=Caenorhabditis angaria TaxID=860376 RepID=A0A9P1MY87_9PELO|nr:unnamed protein product [Caenorhabditis angaria]
MQRIIVAPAHEASPGAVRRLQKDYAKLQQDPVDGIIALPNDANILEWHYCMRGSPDTVYEGGYYWGQIIFKPDFPWSPPSIYMTTPNGRFDVNVRLCLSISDYHPESWNPGWTVASILVGLLSFMNENSHAAGVVSTTPETKKQLAKDSKKFNLTDAKFCKFFPSLVAEWNSSKTAAPTIVTNHIKRTLPTNSSSNNPVIPEKRQRVAAATNNNMNSLGKKQEDVIVLD